MLRFIKGFAAAVVDPTYALLIMVMGHEMASEGGRAAARTSPCLLTSRWQPQAPPELHGPPPTVAFYPRWTRIKGRGHPPSPSRQVGAPVLPGFTRPANRKRLVSRRRESLRGGGRRHGVGLSNAPSGNGQCPLIPLSLLQDADVLLLLSTFVACHHQNCHGR